MLDDTISVADSLQRSYRPDRVAQNVIIGILKAIRCLIVANDELFCSETKFVMWRHMLDSQQWTAANVEEQRLKHIYRPGIQSNTRQWTVDQYRQLRINSSTDWQPVELTGYSQDFVREKYFPSSPAGFRYHRTIELQVAL